MSGIPPPDVRSPLNYIPNSQGATRRVFLDHDPGEKEAAIYDLGTEAMNSMTGYWFKLGSSMKKRVWHGASTGPSTQRAVTWTRSFVPHVSAITSRGPEKVSGTHGGWGYLTESPPYLNDPQYIAGSFSAWVTGRAADDDPGRLVIAGVPSYANKDMYIFAGKCLVENIPWKKNSSSSAADLDDTYETVLFAETAVLDTDVSRWLSVALVKSYPASTLATTLPNHKYVLGHNPQSSNATYRNFRISGTFGYRLEL